MTENTWINGVSGTWTTAADWAGGVPNNSITADATITTPGTYTVTLAAGTSFAVDSVTFNNSTANFDLLGTLALGGGLADFGFDGGVFTLGSTGELVGGTLDIDTGTLLNQGGTIASSDFILGGFASIALGGKALTIGNSALVDGYIVGNNSAGNSLVLTGNATLAGELVLENKVTLVDSGTITQATELSLGGTSTDATSFVINAGAIYDLATVATAFGINGSATVSNAGLFEATGGVATDSTRFNNTGTLLGAAGSDLQLYNGGSLGGTLAGAGEIDLESGAFTLAPTLAVDVAVLTVLNSIASTGTLFVAAGSDVQLDNGGSIAGSVTGAGTIDVESGVLTLGTAAAFNTVTLNIDNSATLLNSGETITAGYFDLTGGATIALVGKALTIGNSALLDGYITGNNTAGSSLVLTGNATLADDLYLENKVTLVDSGTITQATELTLGDTSSDATSFVINAGAIYNLAVSSTAFAINGAATVSNAGLFEETGSGVDQSSAVFKNTGTLLAASGSDLQLENGGSIGGTLAGAGEIDLAAGVFTLAPTLAVNVATLGIFNSVALAGTLLVGAGSDVQLDYAGGVIGGTLKGAGELDLDGGGLFTLSSSLSNSLATLGIFSTAALNGNLTDTGGIYLANAGTLELKAHTLSLAGTSNLQGAILGTGAAGSELIISGTANLGVPGDAYSYYPEIGNDATLLVTGLAIQDNDSVTLGVSSTDKSTISIGATGTYDLVADAVHYSGTGANIDNGGAGTLINAGLLEATGSFAPGNYDYVGVAFYNTGTVLSAAGNDVLFDDGGNIAGTLTGAGEIDLRYGSFSLGTAAVVSVATLGVLGSLGLSGNLADAGGIYLAQPATLALKAHTLSLAGTSTLQGTIVGTGAAGSELIISGTAYLGVPDANQASTTEIYNDATLLVTGLAIQDNSPEQLGSSSTDKSTIAIASTGTYDLVADDINYSGVGSQIYSGGAGTLINAGLLEATGTFAGPGYDDFIQVSFYNTGTVSAAAGNDLQFGGGGTLGGTLIGAGEIDLAAGLFTLGSTVAINVATLGVFSTTALSGNITDSGGISVSNGGTLQLKGHTLSVGGTSTLAGVIVGNGSAGSELIISGAAEVGVVPTAYITTPEIYDDTTLLVTGTAIQDSSYEQLGLNSIDKSTIAIGITGTYDLFSDSINYPGYDPAIYNGGAGSLFNAGLLEATGTPSTGGIDYVDVALYNTGTLLAAAGNDLNFQNGGSVSGTLAGAGEIDFGAGLFTFSPTLAISVATLGIDGTVSLGNSRSYSGDLTMSNSGTLDLNAHILTLASGSVLGGELYGNGAAGSEVIISGTDTLGDPGNNPDTANLPGVYNDATLLVTGVAIQDNDAEQIGLNALDKSTIAIAATGTYDLVSDPVNYNGEGSYIYSGGAGTLINAGLLEATGSLTNGYTDYIGAAIYNTGTILAAAGNDLQLDGGGSIAGTLMGAGEIDFESSGFTLASTIAINVGALGIENSGAVTLGANFNDTGSFILNGGTLALNGHNVTLAGASILESNGTVAGAGTLKVTGQDTMDLLDLTTGAVLEDAGTITQISNLQLGVAAGDTATLKIDAGAVYDLEYQSGPEPVIYDGGSSGSIVNAGILEATGGAADVSVFVNNTGTLLASSGNDLQLFAGGSLSGTLTGAGEIDLAGGLFTLSPTIVLNVADLGIYGTAELTGNLSYAGELNLSESGELALNGHNLTLSQASYLDDSGTLAGGGTLKVASAVVNQFYLTSGAVLEDAGTITQTGNLQLGLAAGDAATLQIDAGAVYNVQAQAGVESDIYSGGNGSIVNAGLLEFTGYWNGQTQPQIGANIKNTGTLLNSGNDLLFTGSLVNDGLVTITSNPIDDGGELTVDGAITADAGKTGTIVLGANTYFDAASSVAGQNIVFATSGTAGSYLDIGSLGGFAGAISGFAAGDVIDLSGLLANTFSYANNILTLEEVTSGVTAVVGSLALASVTGTIGLVTDGGGGTEIILNNTGTSYSNPRAGTTQSNWNGASAAWTTSADWSPTGVPGTLANAVFDTGGAYTVSYATTDTVYELQFQDQGAKLSMSSGKLTVEDGGSDYGTFGISGGTFDAANGFDFYGPVTQAAGGTLEVDNGSLEIDGNAVLAGTIVGGSDNAPVGFTSGGYGDNVTLNSGFALKNVSAYFQSTNVTLGSSFTFAVPSFFYAGVLDLNGHNLTLSGASEFSGNYQIEGLGTLAITGTAQLQSITEYNNAVLIDSGTIFQNGAIQIGNANPDTSSIIINSGAVYDMVDAATAYAISDSGTGSLKNAGLLEVTGYGGDAESIYLPVINTGTILVAEGALNLYGGGTLGGTLAGGDINLVAGSFELTTLAASSSTLSLTGGDIFLGSNVTYAGNFVDTTNNDDIYLNSFSLTLAGQSSLSDGISGPGTLKITGTVTDSNNIAIGRGGVLEDAGTLNLNSEDLQIGEGYTDSGQIKIDAGALLTITTGQIAYYGNNYYGDDSGSVSNSGLLLVNPGSGNTATIEVPLTNNAGGTIAVNSGYLQLVNPSDYYYQVPLTNAGLFTVGAGSVPAAASIDGYVSNTGTMLVTSDSDLNLAGGGTLSGSLGGAGEIDLSSGFTLTSLTASIATLNVSGSEITLGSNISYAGSFIDSGDYDGYGDLLDAIALSGHILTLSGQTNISDLLQGPGTLKVTGTASIGSAAPYYYEALTGGAVLEDAGTLNLSSFSLEFGQNYSDSGQLNIDTGAVFDMTSGSIYYYGNNNYGTDTGGVSNSGLISVNPGSGNAAYIEVPLTNNASGTITVSSGELDITGGLTNSGLFSVNAGSGLTASLASYSELVNNSTGSIIEQGGTFIATGYVANAGSILVNAGDMQFQGGGSLTGSLAGTGEIDLTGGGFVLTSLTASIATLNITGSDITLGSNLTYAGSFLDLNTADTIALSGHSLMLSGQANLTDALQGPGTLKVTGTATLGAAAPNYEILTGGAVLEDAKIINLSGNSLLLLGYFENDSGNLNIDAGAVFNLTDGYVGYDYNGGIYSDTGSIINSGLLSVNAGSGYVASIGAPLTNTTTGTVAVTSGELSITGPVTNSGLFSVTSTNSLSTYIDGPLTNSGKFDILGGQAQVVGAVSNTGTILVNAADLQFQGGGSLKGTLAGTGEIDLTGGAFTLTSLAASIATLTVNDSELTLGSNLTYAGTFIDITGDDIYGNPYDTLTLNGHNLTLSGQVDLADAIQGPGTVKIAGIATIGAVTPSYAVEILAGGAVLEDAKTINLNGDSLVFGATSADSGQLNIDVGAVLNITSGNIFYYNSSSDSGSVANNGLISVNPGVGNAAAIGMPLVNNATGTIAISNGGLVITGPITSTGSILVNAADLQLQDGGKLGGVLAGSGEIDLTAGNFTITSTAVSVGTLNISGSDVTLGSNLTYAGDFIDTDPGDTDTIALAGHTLVLTGQANITELVSGAGTLKVTGTASLGLNNGYLEYLSSGAVLEDAGTISQTAGSNDILSLGVASGDTGYLTIDAGAVYNLGDGVIEPAGGGTGKLTNNGLMSANAGNGNTAYIEVPLTEGATGTIAVTSGQLYINGAISNDSNGTLTGGLWEAIASGTAVSTLDFAIDPAITTDAANIILSGSGADLISGASAPATIEASLTSIAATGTLQNLGGRTFASGNNLINLGSIVLGGGLFAPADIVNTGSISGSGRLVSAVQNGGKIIASGGVLELAGTVTGTGTLGIASGAELILQSGIGSGEVISFSGTNETLGLYSPSTMLGTIAGFAIGDTIDVAGTAVTSTSLNGNKLGITLAGGGVVTETLASTIASGRFAISSDGQGGSDLSLYRAATANLTPTTISFGQHHAGDVVSAGLTLVNTQINDGYSEKLDASFASAGTGITDSGSVTQLAAGSTAAGSLNVGLMTTTGGAINGNTVITLSTDGTGVDGNGALGIGTDTVVVTGTVFNEATAALSGITLALGAHHVGDTVVGYITLGNSAVAGIYSEGLDASFSGTSLSSGSFTDSGSVQHLAAGSVSSNALAVTLGTGSAGSISGNTVLTLTSDGSGIDSLGTTALGSQSITVTGAAYNYASPKLASTIINFGIVHAGASVSQVLTLSNGSANPAFTESLDAAFLGASGSATDAGSLYLLGAGGTNSSNLTVGLLTTGNGAISGTTTLGLTSDGTGIDGLGTTALGSQLITLTGTVDNYATAALEQVSGTGTLTATNATSYVLNLGTIAAGTGNLVDGLGVLNSAAGLADLLGGSFTTSGGSGFTNSGFGTFSGLGAGQADTLPLITLSGTTAGTFSELITLSSTGSNASGYSGALSTITLDVTGVVSSGTIPGVTYTLTSGADTISGGGGNDTIIATSGALSAGDLINGGGGTNTLVLQGGGTFDMRAPTTLSNIQIVDAQENTGSLVQTLYLDSGFSGTVIATSGTTGSSFIVYGNTDSAHITLGTGNDQIHLGSASESVSGGGGNDTFYVTSSDIGATINGGSGANTLVASGGGTFAMGANITSISSVIINDTGTQVTSFAANTIANLAIIGGNGNDVITLGAASQSVTTGTGNTTINASAAQAGALIVDNGSATLNLTSGGAATLNSADQFLSVSLSSATNLMLSPMSFITAIGSSGNDTITALATQQTLSGGAGTDTLVGYSGFGDLFQDTMSGLNGDTISKFGGNDLIDITNLARAGASLTYSGTATAGTLSVSESGVGVVSTITFTSGTNLSASLFHLSSDGRGGTYIG